VFGSHRRAQAVIVPFEVWEKLLEQTEDERDLQLAQKRLDSDTGARFSSADVAAAAGLDRTHHCRDAANIEKSVVVLKEETRGGTSVGTQVARQAVSEGVPGTTYRGPSHQPYYGISGSLSSPRGSP